MAAMTANQFDQFVEEYNKFIHTIKVKSHAIGKLANLFGASESTCFPILEFLYNEYKKNVMSECIDPLRRHMPINMTSFIGNLYTNTPNLNHIKYVLDDFATSSRRYDASCDGSNLVCVLSSVFYTVNHRYRALRDGDFNRFGFCGMPAHPRHLLGCIGHVLRQTPNLKSSNVHIFKHGINGCTLLTEVEKEKYTGVILNIPVVLMLVCLKTHMTSLSTDMFKLVAKCLY